jgi:hypothetical protein
MLPQEFELRVRQAVDNALQGKPNEDSTVELKAEWIDTRKAAKQIGGHANAAHGQNLIWVFGVDERNRQLTSIDSSELSNWHAQFESAFDSRHAPRMLLNQNVVINSATVVAFLFETSNAPYVVNNPVGGDITSYVPWRRGNGTLAAGRADLLQILVPIESVPTVDVLYVDVRRLQDPQSPQGPRFAWSLTLRAFLYPRGHARLTVPFHRCSGVIEFAGGAAAIRLANVSATGLEPVRQSSGSLVIDGPGNCTIVGSGVSSMDHSPSTTLQYNLVLPVYEAGFRSIRITGSLNRITGTGDRWLMNEPPEFTV